MGNIWIFLGAVSGFASVAAGAIGAHGRLDPYHLEVFDKAVRYEMVHALALLAVGILAERGRSICLAVAGWGFTAGTVFFSGSLYALALSGEGRLGRVTPFGGAAFLVGWAALAAAAMRRKG